MEKRRSVKVTGCFEKCDYAARAFDPEQDPIACANELILKKIGQRDSYFEFISEYLMRRNNPAFDEKWAEMDIWAKKLLEKTE